MPTDGPRRAGRRFATETVRDPAQWLAAASERGHALAGEPASMCSQVEAQEYLLMALRLAEGLSLERYRDLRGPPIAGEPYRVPGGGGAVGCPCGQTVRHGQGPSRAGIGMGPGSWIWTDGIPWIRFRKFAGPRCVRGWKSLWELCRHARRKWAALARKACCGALQKKLVARVD